MKYLSLVFFFCSAACFSAESTGYRTILGIGCHNTTDGVCYMNISGAPVGPANCKQSSVRFDTNAIGGKNQLALMTAAYLAGKQIDLFIPDYCFALQPGYPTFTYSYF